MAKPQVKKLPPQPSSSNLNCNNTTNHQQLSVSTASSNKSSSDPSSPEADVETDKVKEVVELPNELDDLEAHNSPTRQANSSSSSVKEEDDDEDDDLLDEDDTFHSLQPGWSCNKKGGDDALVKEEGCTHWKCAGCSSAVASDSHLS
jgi:hypothetical protein